MTPLTNLKSLLAKLRNEARRQNLPANLMLLFYFQERFLARVSQSPYRDQLVLKGGLNLYGRYGSAARPTRDIDLAGRFFPTTVGAIRTAIKDIAAQDLADGVRFDSTTLQAQEIIESANYKGLRVVLKAQFEDAFEHLQLDLSFGNAITPGPVKLRFPSLLSDESHLLLAYPLETIIAEKLAAIIELGEANTRMKDFYDLYWILEHEEIDKTSLQEALRRTFSTRGTPGDRRRALEALATPRAQQAWERFLQGNPVEAPELFGEVLARILEGVGNFLTSDSP